jgi:hypothetical protein
LVWNLIPSVLKKMSKLGFKVLQKSQCYVTTILRYILKLLNRLVCVCHVKVKRSWLIYEQFYSLWSLILWSLDLQWVHLYCLCECDWYDQLKWDTACVTNILNTSLLGYDTMWWCGTIPVFWRAMHFTLMMEAAWSSKMSGSYLTITQCHNPEDHNTNHHCENLRSLKSCVLITISYLIMLH